VPVTAGESLVGIAIGRSGLNPVRDDAALAFTDGPKRKPSHP